MRSGNSYLWSMNSIPRMAGIPVLFFLCHCSKSEYQPVFPEKASWTVHHLGAYSSKLGEGREVQGTQFQGRLRLSWTKQGGGWRVQRRLDSLGGRGYHKNSMPDELEKKADLDIELGPDRIPLKISGYDTLLAALARIEQKDQYRKQLLSETDTLHFQALLRDMFRLRALLKPGVWEINASIAVAEMNSALETLKLDSAQYQGPRPRIKRSCLEYEVYYHREDSLALLVEQFFFSASAHRKWRKSTWSPATVMGLRHFSVDQRTGLPCFESITETAVVLLKNAEDKTEQPVTLYRYAEDLYVP